MAGEVVIGGRQDRIIGKNTIVAPKATEAVPVFCVEHGRWSGRKADFESAESLAHTELRKKASFSDQQAVWDEVAAKNAARKISNETGTYQQVARGSAVRQSIASYQLAFRPAIARAPQRERQVGYVVALNGKVVAIETFGSPALFKKFEDKLLRSYYVEAVDRQSPDGKPAAAPKPADVTGFASKAKAARRNVVLQKPAATTMQFDEVEVKGSEVNSKDGESVYRGAYE
jgi:hypothetical protein